MIFKKVRSQIEANKRRSDAGETVTIPFPFARFGKHIPGIDRKMYIGLTANQKVGKSQLTDEMFVFHPFEYWLKHRNFTLKIFYFSLELSVESKIKKLISRLLYKKYGRRISPLELDSKFEGRSIDEEDLGLINKLESYFVLFEQCVKYITHLRSPKEIFNYLKRYAENNGEVITQADGSIKYNYPEDEFRIVIVDHISLLRNLPEHTQRETLGVFSSDYMLELRDTYGYTIVSVQQQAQAQEGIKNFELDRLQPSVDGLGNNKEVSRDYDLLLGLFNPSRFRINRYNGYDIDILGDHYRELNVINNRDGEPIATSLYFDGAVNYFKELPPSFHTEDLKRIYDTIPK